MTLFLDDWSGLSSAAPTQDSLLLFCLFVNNIIITLSTVGYPE
jgi:hypothetical protein